MIKLLKIKNFQSHDNTVLEFSPGLNAITGDSQAGKTSILRALYAILNNKKISPSKLNNYVKDKFIEIELETFEENILKLNKKIITNKKNERTIKDTVYTIDGEEYKALGQNIPEKAKEILNISEVNIQKQLEPGFLITSNTGEMTRTINRLTRLEESDNWVKELTSSVNKLNTKEKIIRSDIKKYKDDFKRFDGLENLKEQIDSYENYKNKIEVLKNKSETLNTLYNNAQYLIESIESLKGILRYVLKFEQEYNAITSEIKQYKTIIALIAKYQTLKIKIAITKKRLKINDDLEKIIIEIDKILPVINLLESHISTDKEIEDLKKQIQKKTIKYKTELKKLKKCPICNSKINNNIIKEIKL